MTTTSSFLLVALSVHDANTILFSGDITHACHSECPTWEGAVVEGGFKISLLALLPLLKEDRNYLNSLIAQELDGEFGKILGYSCYLPPPQGC